MEIFVLIQLNSLNNLLLLSNDWRLLFYNVCVRFSLFPGVMHSHCAWLQAHATSCIIGSTICPITTTLRLCSPHDSSPSFSFPFEDPVGFLALLAVFFGLLMFAWAVLLLKSPALESASCCTALKAHNASHRLKADLTWYSTLISCKHENSPCSKHWLTYQQPIPTLRTILIPRFTMQHMRCISGCHHHCHSSHGCINDLLSLCNTQEHNSSNNRSCTSPQLKRRRQNWLWQLKLQKTSVKVPSVF